jgi:hypothetical protein
MFIDRGWRLTMGWKMTFFAAWRLAWLWDIGFYPGGKILLV